MAPVLTNCVTGANLHAFPNMSALSCMVIRSGMLFLMICFVHLPRNAVSTIICEVGVVEIDGEVVAGVFAPAVVKISFIQESCTIRCIAGHAYSQKCCSCYYCKLYPVP